MSDTNLPLAPSPQGASQDAANAKPDRTLWGIGGLALSAAALLAVYLAPISPLTPAPPAARANEVANARDYQLATASVPGVGDALYILDTRGGMMAVLTWDPASRTVKVRNVQSVETAFR